MALDVRRRRSQVGAPRDERDGVLPERVLRPRRELRDHDRRRGRSDDREGRAEPPADADEAPGHGYRLDGPQTARARTALTASVSLPPACTAPSRRASVRFAPAPPMTSCRPAGGFALAISFSSAAPCEGIAMLRPTTFAESFNASANASRIGVSAPR